MFVMEKGGTSESELDFRLMNTASILAGRPLQLESFYDN